MGKILFVACTNVGISMIDEICNNSNITTEIVGIVNLNSKRGIEKSNYHSYADVSIKYNIPVYYCNNINDVETCDWIKNKSPDIIIQSGWSQKFKEEILNIPRYGCIGEHPAPLPKGRGAACINWAILNGETTWGDTFFKMVNAYDRGDVYAQEAFEIKEYDNVKTVYDKVALCSRKIVSKNIDKWSNNVFETITLDEKEATYYKKRTPSDGLFNFNQSAKEIHDFIRAQTDPYPGAFFILNDEKVTVLSSKNRSKVYNNNFPGDVVGITNEGGILVVCGDKNVIELLRFRTEDNCEMWFGEYEKFQIENLNINNEDKCINIINQ